MTGLKHCRLPPCRGAGRCSCVCTGCNLPTEYVKHVRKEGARFHVLSWHRVWDVSKSEHVAEEHCSEMNCEKNRPWHARLRRELSIESRGREPRRRKRNIRRVALSERGLLRQLEREVRAMLRARSEAAREVSMLGIRSTLLSLKRFRGEKRFMEQHVRAMLRSAGIGIARAR